MWLSSLHTSQAHRRSQVGAHPSRSTSPLADFASAHLNASKMQVSQVNFYTATSQPEQSLPKQRNDLLSHLRDQKPATTIYISRATSTSVSSRVWSRAAEVLTRNENEKGSGKPCSSPFCTMSGWDQTEGLTPNVHPPLK